jgi:Uma2 family endonuclease
VKTQLYLTPKDQGRAISLEEFEHADGLEGYHYELIDGKLEVSPQPDLPHDFLCEWLGNELRAYARRHPEVINQIQSPARVFVPGHTAPTAPQPDVVAYRDFPHGRPLRQLRWQDVSPLLVAEVISAETADKDFERNVPLYLEVSSIREYWILDHRQDADRPTLIVHRRRGQRWQRAIEVVGGATYRTRLLPGFELLLDVRPEQP